MRPPSAVLTSTLLFAAALIAQPSQAIPTRASEQIRAEIEEACEKATALMNRAYRLRFEARGRPTSSEVQSNLQHADEAEGLARAEALKAFGWTMDGYGIEAPTQGDVVMLGSGRWLRRFWAPTLVTKLSGFYKTSEGQFAPVLVDYSAAATTWPNGAVFISTRAFQGADFLACVIVHELQHYLDLSDAALADSTDREIRSLVADLAFNLRLGLEADSRKQSLASLRRQVNKKRKKLKGRDAIAAAAIFEGWLSTTLAWLEGGPIPDDPFPPRTTLEPVPLPFTPNVSPNVDLGPNQSTQSPQGPLSDPSNRSGLAPLKPIWTQPQGTLSPVPESQIAEPAWHPAPTIEPSPSTANGELHRGGFPPLRSD